MRRVVIAQVALLCAMSATVGHASPGGLDVLSSYQKIWGSAECEVSGDIFVPPDYAGTSVHKTYQGSYSEEGPWNGARLLAGVEPYRPWLYAWSHMDALYAAVGSTALPFSEEPDFGEGYLDSVGPCANGHAQGYWDFRPHGRGLLLEIDVFGGIKEEYPPSELFPPRQKNLWATTGSGKAPRL